MDTAKIVNCFGGTIHVAEVSVNEDGEHSYKEVSIFPFTLGSDKVAFVQPSGNDTLLGYLRQVDTLNRENDIPLIQKDPSSEVMQLPDSEKNTYFIVSKEIREKLSNRKDLLSPVYVPMIPKGGVPSTRFVCVGFEVNENFLKEN